MSVLPPLTQTPSPNRSSRGDVVPYLVVVHRPVGSYEGTVKWLCDPQAQASAHIVTEDSKRAAQLVPWDVKAWACVAFNSASYNLEVDDDAWNGRDPGALATAARIVAFLCKRTGIPPVWTHDPIRLPGFCRHYDLGRAGGGHTDPTTDPEVWRGFAALVKHEYDRGGFRETWGVGTLHRIDV